MIGTVPGAHAVCPRLSGGESDKIIACFTALERWFFWTFLFQQSADFLHILFNATGH